MRKLLTIIAATLLFGLLFQPIARAAKPSVDPCAVIKDGTIEDSTGREITLGYDQWGYNYEAHMFNGWFNNYTRPTEPVSEGDRLMMKWSDSWLSNKDCNEDGLLDRPSPYRGSGAWLTNHATGTYEGETFNVTGSYIFGMKYLGIAYNHDMFLTEMPDGTLTGNGGNPVGGPYVYPWVITSGNATGNSIDFYADYTAGAIGTTLHMVGTVEVDGSMSGTWSDNLGGGRTGTWATETGFYATPDLCTWSDFVKIIATPNDANLIEGYWYQNGVKIGPEIWGEFAIIQEISSDPCGNATGLLNYKSELRSGLGNW